MYYSVFSQHADQVVKNMFRLYKAQVRVPRP